MLYPWVRPRCTRHVALKKEMVVRIGWRVKWKAMVVRGGDNNGRLPLYERGRGLLWWFIAPEGRFIELDSIFEVGIC